MCSLGPPTPRWDVRRRKTTRVEREQWGLSSTHVELFSLTAMTIRRTASQSQSHKKKENSTNSLLFLHLSCFLYCSLNSNDISFLPLPAITVSFWLHWKQITAQDRLSAEYLPKHNGFYVCNSHCFELSVLGWAAYRSPKRCISFNMSVHEYCMAGREEARVLGKSLQDVHVQVVW